MVRELEIAGVASAGGWLRWRKKHAIAPGTPCANCETVLEGPYCHTCGQLAENFERSVVHLLAEGFESFFHVDGRLWRTLPNLAVHPGRLTRHYLDGKRAYQIPPFRLFLVVLLIVFFVGGLNWSGSMGGGKTNFKLGAAPAHGPGASVSVGDKTFTNVGIDTDDLDEVISAAKVAQKTHRPLPPEEQRKGGEILATLDAVRASGLPMQEADRKLMDEKAAELRAAGVTPIKDDAKKSGLSTWMEDHVKRAVKNPELFWMTVENWGHRAAFMMLPLAALWLSLLFVFQRRFYIYDHLIFSMHSLAFQGLLLSTAFLLSPLSGWVWLLLFLAPVHLFVHMRGTYGSSVLGTLARMFVLFWGSVIGFTFLMMGLLWISLAAMDR
jgi:hypothetical protein